LLDPQLTSTTDQLADSILKAHLDSGVTREQGIVSPRIARTLAVYIRERSAFAIAAGHKWSLNEVDTGKTLTTERYVIRVETVVKGLESPWAMAFLPDGRMLVTEKAGRLRIVQDMKLDPRSVEGVPEVVRMGQGGLFDVSVDPIMPRTDGSISHMRRQALASIR
jgi:glucose/arabinose dehydrogenase